LALLVLLWLFSLFMKDTLIVFSARQAVADSLSSVPECIYLSKEATTFSSSKEKAHSFGVQEMLSFPLFTVLGNARKKVMIQPQIHSDCLIYRLLLVTSYFLN
jgi:hypothetical protein